MLIAVEPPDLIVVDVAARRHRVGATGHTGGDQPVVQRLGRNPELDRQSRDRLVVIDLRRHRRRHVRSANRARHHPHPFHPGAWAGGAPNRARPRLPEPHQPRSRPSGRSFPRGSAAGGDDPALAQSAGTIRDPSCRQDRAHQPS
jgi:hypothetical protein